MTIKLLCKDVDITDSKISSRQENMKLETCSVSLPPHLGGDVGDLWTADRVPCCLRWQPGHGHANLW